MNTPLLSALGLLSSLNLGRRAVSAQQKALQVVGRNIANVNTPGFTRQRAVVGVPDTRAEILAGEDRTRIERVRDDLVERLLLQERQLFGSLSKRAHILGQVEAAFGEPSDSSLNTQLDRFFGAWTALANSPESDAAKNVVIERSKTLAAIFGELSRRLGTIQERNITDARELVDQVNSKLEQIRTLNEHISNAVNSGSEFLELQDQQEQIIRSLSDILAVRVLEGPSGMRTIQANGLSLVEARIAGRLELVVGNEGQLMFQANLDGSRFDIQPRAGSLHGLMVVQNETLPTIANDLHSTARAIVEQVNRLHPNFFRPLTSEEQRQRAGLFMEVLARGPGDVKPTATKNSGANEIALAVADLRLTPLGELGNQSPPGFYQELIGALGARVGEVNQQKDTAELLVQQLEQRREGISGVSLDEEATDLIVFQRAFQAAARYIQVIDELVETLIQQV